MYQKKTMPRFWKRTLPAALAVLTVLSLTACSLLPEKTSKTKALFEGITKDTGIHMKYTLESDGTTVTQDMYKKGSNFYADTSTGDVSAIVIVKDDTMYALDPSSKKAVKAELTGENKEKIAQSMASIDGIYEMGTSDEKCTRGTVKIDGMEYDSEEFSSEGGTSKFVFNDDGELVYILTTSGDTELKMKIDALSGDVPEGQFEVPDGYQVSDPKAVSEETRTVTSYKGGFSFQTKKSFITEINGEYVDVYLENQSSVPCFNVYPMMQLNNETVERFNDRNMAALKKSYGDTLIEGPEKITIDVNGREVKGYECTYSSDGGKTVVHRENFAELYNGTFYSWSASYLKGDEVTPAEIRAAMASFKLN